MFNYKVISKNLSISKYIIDLLKIYGLCYGWIACESIEFNNVISIQINTIDGEKVFHLIISDDAFGNWNEMVDTIKAIPNGWFSLKYIEKSVPFLVWNDCVYSIKIKDNFKADNFCFLENNCIGIYFDQDKDFFLAINLLIYLENSMLGIPSLNEKEDWCEINGYMKSHNYNNAAFVDEILLLIRSILMKYSPCAIPIIIDFYPNGKIAPLLLTGDSDESTMDEILNYYTTIDNKKYTSCLLINNINLTEDLSKSEIFYKHCFGIHPFTKTRNFSDYCDSISILHKQTLKSRNINIATRNHLFQNIDARLQIQAEKDLGIIFDMNSISANGNTWIGTGNGIGVPIPFPPINDQYSPYPLSLPTVIEDDVFLFDLDYCYKPNIDSILSSEELIISFLNDWILKQRKPAQINMHPQNKQDILLLIIDWAAQNNIWNPSLMEYYSWLIKRNDVLICTDYDGSYSLSKADDEICIIKGFNNYENI